MQGWHTDVLATHAGRRENDPIVFFS